MRWSGRAWNGKMLFLCLRQWTHAVDKLRQALNDPQAFLLKHGGPVATKMLLFKFRPKAEKVLVKQGLTREDALPALQLVDSLQELQDAMSRSRGCGRLEDRWVR